MIRTQIQLTEEQLDALKKMAMAYNLSMAELIRQAINAMVKSGIIIDIEERRKRAIAVAGRFHSGLRDISSKHDKYLNEVYSN